MKKIAQQRCGEQRNTYHHRMRIYTADQLVFVDESDSTELNCRRRTNWNSINIDATTHERLNYRRR
jgi:hypothetical protein